MAAKIQNGRHNVKFYHLFAYIWIFWLKNHHEDHGNDWKLSGEYNIKILKLKFCYWEIKDTQLGKKHIIKTIEMTGKWV